MKVRMIVTLDVDQEQWARAYGLTNEAKVIREDVQTFVEQTLPSIVAPLAINVKVAVSRVKR